VFRLQLLQGIFRIVGQWLFSLEMIWKYTFISKTERSAVASRLKCCCGAAAFHRSPLQRQRSMLLADRKNRQFG
jgi:hypothetical protein